MRISQKGLDLLKEFEGLFLKAYKCQAGVWTIGYGTIKYPNGTPVKKGDTCSKEDAERWLEFEVNEKSAYFNQVIGKENIILEQCEYDGLISFLYNLGMGKCQKGTTMGDAIHSKNKKAMAEAFLIYCKYTRFGIKLVSKGLLRRRQAEKLLFEGKR